MSLTLPTRSAGDWTVVRLSGEIDLDTGALVRDALLSTISAGSHRLVLDMTEVTFIDSSGLNVLVSTYRRLQLVDGDIRLVISSTRVLDTFQMTGLDRFFAIAPTVEDALTAPLCAPAETTSGPAALGTN